MIIDDVATQANSLLIHHPDAITDFYFFKNKCYITDGAYYPKKGLIKYFNSQDVVPDLPKTGPFNHEDIKINIENDFKFSSYFKVSFEELVFKTNDFLSYMWGNAGKYSTPMIELYTFNHDGTYRWYMFPPTCKAKIYRIVREVASRVQSDNIEAFIWNGVMIYHEFNNEFVDLNSKHGKEAFISLGFKDDKLIVWGRSNKEVAKGNPPSRLELIPNFMIPLMFAVSTHNSKNKE